MLRIAVAASLFADSSGRMLDSAAHFTAALVLSVLLILGFFTPLAAALAAMLHGVFLVFGGAQWVAVMAIEPFHALALTLMGPGAYSLDARLFGRRLVVFRTPQ